MKRHTASQLTALLKAKTQLERFHYEEVKLNHANALNCATALHNEAITQPTTELANTNAGAYRLHEKRVSYLLASAKAEKQRANEMLGALEENHQQVKSALQRELALKELSKRLDENHRKSRNKIEESQHEHVRSIKQVKQLT